MSDEEQKDDINPYREITFSPQQKNVDIPINSNSDADDKNYTPGVNQNDSMLFN